MNEWIILTLVGALAGLLSGMLGIGGGVIIIPSLVYVLGMSQKSAQGTSLAMMIPPIGIMAAMQYYKEGFVNIKYAAILAIVFFFGAYFGSKLVVSLDPKILRRVFALFLFFVAGKMFFQK